MTEQPPFDPKKTLPVDWNPISEQWETFKLSDGTKIKSKLNVIGFRRSLERNQSGEPYYSWASNNSFTVIECSLKGEPTNPLAKPEQLNNPDNHEETVDFESTSRQENWNVYNLVDGTIIRLRLMVQRIVRTKFRDGFGEPLYWINSQIVSRIKVAQNLIVKPTPKVETDVSKPYG